MPRCPQCGDLLTSTEDGNYYCYDCEEYFDSSELEDFEDYDEEDE